ncbi:hypothetical protein MXD63_38785, partial [Frankia sp. Cpl3]|nr:hypothetical protein [Frankia sp. Cpl3]
VMDDTVILGQSYKHHYDGSRYDAMQSKLLSGYAGTSATGPHNSTGYTGTKGTSGSAAKDGTKGTSGTHTLGATGTTGGTPMEQARREINRIFGGNVRVLTVTDPRGVEAINRVKANLNSAASPNRLSKDLSIIMKMASGKGTK